MTISPCPQRSTRAKLLRLLAFLAIFTPALLVAEAISIADFLALQPQWEKMAETGESLRIEGRIESASGPLIRLRKCPVPLRPVNDPFPELRRNTTRIEAAGRLERRLGEIVFVVREMKEVPGDGDRYALKESALDEGDPADWYGLADWALARGRFYDDQFLLRKATEARRTGFALERHAAADDPAALMILAQKADGFELGELSQELAHESLRLRWDRLRQDPSSDLSIVIDEIKERFPEAAAPLMAWPADVAGRYAAEPLAVFNRATAEERPTLARLLFAEVQLAAIERTAGPEGANGDLVAGMIEAAVPERADLADQYREREIAYRIKKIETATRSEALDLATRLEERDRADEAKHVLKHWLAAREATLRKDGPAGLIVVAEDYAAVLGDQETAARLLVEALAESPKSETIPEKLRQLGYVLNQGEWITKEEAATRPVDAITLAMREGRVTVGMSPDQVRKTLGGPDRVARAAGASQVQEAWIYGQPGRSGLVVHFLRYAARGPDEARVVGVASLAR